MARLAFFIGGAILWLLLTWNLRADSLIVGLVVVCLTTVFFGQRLGRDAYKFLNPRRWYWFVKYMFVFVYYMVKANIDVAYRVVHPERPINPGIVKVKTSLKSDLARTFLANSITLTPGTLSVEIDGDTLYIHWIDVRAEEVDKASKLIAGKFEPYLKEVFD